MITTCHYTDFMPVEACTAFKRRYRETISVVLPALNEARTIGPIVAAIKSFMDASELIDEIIVIDGGSEDDTIRHALEAGARVVETGRILPSVTAPGKGTALWKSQFIATGSIIVFIDTDILNFDERFIVGPVGALLRHRTLELVKACYRRPLSKGDTTIDDNGGRVTELFLRPLLNQFLPDLAQLIQPLAGEYAVRRESLAAKVFYSGYGVETALILAYYFAHGIASIGQVDLDIRTHRNRSLPELSRMASDIGEAFFALLEEHNGCIPRRPGNRIITTWESGILKQYPFQSLRLPPKNSITGVADNGI